MKQRFRIFSEELFSAQVSTAECRGIPSHYQKPSPKVGLHLLLGCSPFPPLLALDQSCIPDKSHNKGRLNVKRFLVRTL